MTLALVLTSRFLTMTGNESLSGVRWVVLNEDCVNSVVEMKTVPDRLQPKPRGVECSQSFRLDGKREILEPVG